MATYKLNYWFEHGGGCLWGMNDATQEKYGYAIDIMVLPLSKPIMNQLIELEEEYGTYLDWDNPREPSKWSMQQKLSFLEKAAKMYQLLSNELGSDFEIINNTDRCV